MTEAHSPTDPRSDWPSDRSAPPSEPTTRGPASERVDPSATVDADGADGADETELELVDLDAIEADLDRVESALQQLADGTYWDQNGTSVEAGSDAMSTATSTSGPSASA